MQVAACGNSLAVRLPAVIGGALEIKEGDDLEIPIAAGARELIVSRTSKELVKRLSAFRDQHHHREHAAGRLRDDFTFGGEDAVMRGVIGRLLSTP